MGSRYPITPIPFIAPTREALEQEDQYAPLVEVDDRLGFYFGVDLVNKNAVKLQYLYYDNQADQEDIRSGQYGWKTQFHHIAVQWQINAATKLLSQWIDGRTEMGDRLVIANFRSRYVMVVRDWGKSRLAWRWEDFGTTDRDETPMDTNHEDGRSLTLSLSHLWSKKYKATIELRRWESERPGQIHSRSRRRSR